jgi:hypothetical protein
MAKIICGILDGFIGKVGTVVGSFWKGKAVMRAYKKQVHDKGSKAQVMQRMRFATLGNLASSFLEALRLGMHGTAQKMRITECDLFVKRNMGNVIVTWPDTVEVDYSSLLVSEGKLAEVHFGSPQFDEPLTVEVGFTANGDAPGASADDDIYLLVYCPDDGRGLLSAPVKRNAESVRVTVPGYWSGAKVQLWGFCVNQDGVASKSCYVGSGNID